MIKKLWVILQRDTLSAKRDTLMVYIVVIPLVLAVFIQLFSPGLTQTTLKVGLLESDTKEHIRFMESYGGTVELFSTPDELEERVLKRDELVGILPLTHNEGYEIVVQGNETPEAHSLALTLQSLYDLGAISENSTTEIFEFHRMVPPIKAKLVNMLILLTTMLTGMIIALGIVEEKQQNTVQALHVTPLTQGSFILGKSLFGGIATLIGIVGTLIITGFYHTNWIMIILVGLSSMVLSILIGFLQGIHSHDVIEAAAGVKVLMVPIAGSIVGYELLSPQWQWTMYWSPFYWSYKANDLILLGVATWGKIILPLGLVWAISFLVYCISIPRIRRGLQ